VGLLTNSWAWAQFAHNQMAALVTASFVVSAVGAYWLLKGVHLEDARRNLTLGTTAGLVAAVAVAFPTGDMQAKLVAKHQPVSLAAMEGRFESGPRAGLRLIGQPNVAERKLDNPVEIPVVLSFLAFGAFSASVQGLNDFPVKDWPTNVELLYYSFHVMAGLGTLFIGLMGLAALFRWRKWLERSRWLLWALMLAFPFPYIANTAGWMTAELGRQPWLVYGLFRTAEGASPTVHAGSALFTILGFSGLYLVLAFIFAFLVAREIQHGPGGGPEVAHA
jgi:cytochrome d ubiquinol oxidase subunit I